jgi:hypothetical protein
MGRPISDMTFVVVSEVTWRGCRFFKRIVDTNQAITVRVVKQIPGTDRDPQAAKRAQRDRLPEQHPSPRQTLMKQSQFRYRQ